MTENDLRILAISINTILILIMICSGLWVGYDARKNKLTTAELVSWMLFATAFIGIGLIAYLFFRSKIYNKKRP